MILRHVDLGAELWWHYSADWPSGRVVLARRRDNRFADAITPASIIARSYLDNIRITHFKDNSSGIWKRERERKLVVGTIVSASRVEFTILGTGFGKSP